MEVEFTACVGFGKGSKGHSIHFQDDFSETIYGLYTRTGTKEVSINSLLEVSRGGQKPPGLEGPGISLSYWSMIQLTAPNRWTRLGARAPPFFPCA